MDLAANIQSDLAALRPDGEIVVYGSGAAEIAVPFFASLLKNVRYQFFVVYNLNAADRAAAIAGVSRLLRENKLKHQIAARMPLSKAAEAHRLVESGQRRRNVVLDHSLTARQASSASGQRDNASCACARGPSSRSRHAITLLPTAPTSANLQDRQESNELRRLAPKAVPLAAIFYGLLDKLPIWAGLLLCDSVFVRDVIQPWVASNSIFPILTGSFTLFAYLPPLCYSFVFGSDATPGRASACAARRTAQTQQGSACH